MELIVAALVIAAILVAGIGLIGYAIGYHMGHKDSNPSSGGHT